MDRGGCPRGDTIALSDSRGRCPQEGSLDPTCHKGSTHTKDVNALAPERFCHEHDRHRALTAAGLHPKAPAGRGAQTNQVASQLLQEGHAGLLPKRSCCVPAVKGQSYVPVSDIPISSELERTVGTAIPPS